ncbi:hypothetical protein MUK42_23926 [Musa troglodytarum]|uniref:Uncharacterized protein n=1 Tax=Musa troglodytarum TaxID=320322 RepID=A0A9E7LA84_9LILI|nr:hypothetical protein MUK42_23926 [Musa troglodytarum]
MLSRSAVLGRAVALRRRAMSCAQAPFVPTRATSGVPPLSPRPDFYVRDRYLSTLTALLLRPPGCFRGYARMRRRSPPVQRPPESESESESESDAEESDLTAEEAGQIDDDGDESEEWEGFMIDFGGVGKDTDDDNDNQVGS